MKTYAVKSIFRTIQGEGFWSGRVAVFVRFAGCNLWNGRGEDRSKGAGTCAAWCDTDFLGGERLDAATIADRAELAWGGGPAGRFLVLTGGEPSLQLDRPLVRALGERGFYTAVETNGTRELPAGIDWVTCSPKAGAPVRLEWCDELKFVYPQPGLSPEEAAALFAHGCGRRFLQPLDGPGRETIARAAVRYCLDNPGWRLGLQMHKALGIP